jgi:hypothetical protein
MKVLMWVNRWRLLVRLWFRRVVLDGIGDVSRLFVRANRNFIVLSGLYPLEVVDGRVVVRDNENVGTKIETNIMDDLKMLEYMLVEQPPAPLSLMEMYSEYINGVTISSYQEPTSHRYHVMSMLM